MSRARRRRVRRAAPATWPNSRERRRTTRLPVTDFHAAVLDRSPVRVAEFALVRDHRLPIDISQPRAHVAYRKQPDELWGSVLPIPLFREVPTCAVGPSEPKVPASPASSGQFLGNRRRYRLGSGRSLCLVHQTCGVPSAFGDRDMAPQAARTARAARHRMSTASLRVARLGGARRADRQRQAAIPKSLHRRGSSLTSR